MKRYATTYSNGHTVESSRAHEANNWINYGGEQVFMLDGAHVSPEAFYAGVAAAIDAAWNKKLETHKRVRSLHGSSVGCYVEKWVAR